MALKRLLAVLTPIAEKAAADEIAVVIIFAVGLFQADAGDFDGGSLDVQVAFAVQGTAIDLRLATALQFQCACVQLTGVCRFADSCVVTVTAP
ncbi:hypothetical protein D3C85_761260 [compost metagenome]